MKRRDLIKELTAAGYKAVRTGDHEIYEAPNNPPVQIPLHREINENTARNILKVAGLR